MQVLGKVVNVAKASYDVYVGRANSSPFGNPFHIGRDGTRSQVIAKFKVYLFTNPVLLTRVRSELRGKILGCHCKPAECHGDTLCEIANMDDKDWYEFSSLLDTKAEKILAEFRELTVKVKHMSNRFDELESKLEKIYSKIEKVK